MVLAAVHPRAKVACLGRFSRRCVGLVVAFHIVVSASLARADEGVGERRADERVRGRPADEGAGQGTADERARARAADAATRVVFVHVDSPELVNLERETGARYEPFATICSSPCDTLVPADGKYRISSDSVRPSHSFLFPIDAQREDLRVRPGSRGGFTAGILLLSVGSLAAAIGTLWVLSQGLGDGASSQDSHQGSLVGGSLMFGGLAAVAGGIVLAALNGRTKVSPSASPWATPPPVTPSESGERILLLPTRSRRGVENALRAVTTAPGLPAATAAPGLPAATVASVLSIRF